MLRDALRNLSALRSPVAQAAAKFQSQRFDYYRNLADLLDVTSGNRSLTFVSIFERDAERFAGEVKGILSARWAELYMDSGARLSAAWEGTMPSNEVAWIAIAETHGMPAVIDALRDIARVGENIAKSRQEFVATVGVGLLSATLTIAMLLAMPYFFRPFLLKNFSGIEPEYYGPLTVHYFQACNIVAKSWMPTLAVLGGVAYWLKWAIPNWTGPTRRMLDEKNFLFSLYRSFKGSEFLATFASLTKSSGGAVTNQRDALRMMQERAGPWIDWKIRMILERIDVDGLNDASILDVGIVDRETYYLIHDVQDARGISDGLTVAGRKTEERVASKISKRSKWIRWVLLLISVVNACRRHDVAAGRSLRTEGFLAGEIFRVAPIPSPN
jgi:type II secretory pathway component PulF